MAKVTLTFEDCDDGESVTISIQSDPPFKGGEYPTTAQHVALQAMKLSRSLDGDGDE